MGRGFTLFMLGAALGFCGGQKTERMLGAAKPSSILSHLRDYFSGGGGGPEERRVRQQVEESLSRETARITAELRKEMREGQVQMFAAIADELKRLRDGGRPDDQHGSSSSHPSSNSS